jgi:hypothetical protein
MFARRRGQLDVYSRVCRAHLESGLLAGPGHEIPAGRVVQSSAFLNARAFRQIEFILNATFAKPAEHPEHSCILIGLGDFV